jgi:MFS family permease
VSAVTLGLAYGVWYSYSVFLVALLREFGWSRSLVAGAFSLFVLVHGGMAPALGWLADRVGPRRLILAGGILLAAALLLDAAVTRPWQLYLAFGVLTSMGVAAAGWVPAVILVQRWYPLRVGAALGLASAGIGMGIFLVVPFCQYLIGVVGWRAAFRVVAALVTAWIVPASFWLLRDPPVRLVTGASWRVGGGPTADVTLGQALGTLRFWLVATAQTLGSFACQMLLVHQVAYLVDHRVSVMVAASVVSVVGLASVFGKAGGGWFSDSFGRELTYTLGMASVVASVATLAAIAAAPAPIPLAAYVYGVLIGVGYSVTAPLMPALVSDLFRGRHFGAIFGTLQAANAIGGSVGPWLGGRVFDATGSYAWAFGGAVVAAAIATSALWVAGPRRVRARAAVTV